jgi:hypothetical protein
MTQGEAARALAEERVAFEQREAQLKVPRGAVSTRWGTQEGHLAAVGREVQTADAVARGPGGRGCKRLKDHQEKACPNPFRPGLAGARAGAGGRPRRVAAAGGRPGEPAVRHAGGAAQPAVEPGGQADGRGGAGHAARPGGVERWGLDSGPLALCCRWVERPIPRNAARRRRRRRRSCGRSWRRRRATGRGCSRSFGRPRTRRVDGWDGSRLRLPAGRVAPTATH